MYFDLSHPLEDSPLDSVTHKQREAMALSLGYARMAVVSRTLSSGQVSASASDRCSDGSDKHVMRLNLIMTETIHPGPALVSMLQSYDLIAVIPRSERAMQQACTSLDCDIISLDLNQRLPFKLKPALLSAAVKRGIHFEILYSGLLRDPTSRRHLINNSQALTRLLRGRNVILGSGARNAFELRGPADVMALATELLGFASKDKAKMAMTQGPKDAIDKGLLRKEGRMGSNIRIEVQMEGETTTVSKRKRA